MRNYPIGLCGYPKSFILVNKVMVKILVILVYRNVLV